MRARLVIPLLIATLLTGCGSGEECEADFVLGNAIDYAYVWRDPSTECSLTSSAPGSIELRTGTSKLEFRTTAPIVMGAQLVEVIFISKEGISWSNYEGSALCTMEVLSMETVDWVFEDHLRISGTVECSGFLTSAGEPGLSIAAVTFTVYAADDGYFF